MALIGRLVASEFYLLVRPVLVRDLCCTDILGDVDEDWTLPAGVGDIECFPDDPFEIFDILNKEVMFCHRHRDPGDV